jgi:hypothetical protein
VKELRKITEWLGISNTNPLLFYIQAENGITGPEAFWLRIFFVISSSLPR